MKKIMLGVLLILSLVFVFGCSSDEELADSDLVLHDFVEDDVGDDVPRDVDESSSPLDELKSLIDGAVEYRVVYDYSFGDQVMSMTQYVKGNNMRMDMSVMGMESRSYTLGDSFVSCLNQAGSWFCFDASSQDDGSDLDSFSVEDPLSSDFTDFDGEVRKAPNRVVAGVQANCFEVLFEDSSYVYCYSSSGIPLLFEGDGDLGSWSMSAKEFSSSVASNVFDLPAELSSPDDMAAAWGFPNN